MSKHKDTQPKDLLSQLFLEQELDSPKEAARLYEALQHNTSLQREYNTLALASRQLESHQGDDLSLSTMEEHFGELSFMHALDQQLAEEEHHSTPDNVVHISFFKKYSQHIAVAALLLTTLGASLVWTTQNPEIPTDQDTFSPRGDILNTTHYMVHDVTHAHELEVFCISQEQGKKSITSLKKAPLGLLSCAQESDVQFAYNSSQINPNYLEHLAIFGVDSAGKLLWYGPSPVQQKPHKILPSASTTPLPPAIALNVNHNPGTIRVYGIFSQSPLTYDILNKMLMKIPKDALYNDPQSLSPTLRQLDQTTHAVSLTFDVIEVPLP